MTRIIFNPVAEPHFLQHFEIVLRAHFQPLRFKEFSLGFKVDNARFELFANGTKCSI